jgi:hypothetical protein
MKTAARLALLTGLTLLSACRAQPADDARSSPSKAESQNGVPSRRTYIVRYYVEKAVPGTTYETGPLHIVYSDGTELIERPPQREQSTADDTVEHGEGFSDPQLAEDKNTIGWTELYDNCCTSYAIPLVLVVSKSGAIIRRIQQGQMVWYWTFLDGGKRVAVVWGPTHGSDAGDYQLYDVKTGRMLSEVYGEESAGRHQARCPQVGKTSGRENG